MKRKSLKYNEEDMLEVAKAMAIVRETGYVNMLDRRGVVDVLFEIGDDFSAHYVLNNIGQYTNLLQLSEQF